MGCCSSTKRLLVKGNVDKCTDIWGCTPPDDQQHVPIEDTFWKTKRKLIPNFSKMERIDAHVSKVS